MDNNPTVIANHLWNLKFTDDSCIDTLAVELNDHVNRYRASMTLHTFNLLDASAISSIASDTYIWTYAFIADKDLWEVIKNSVSTPRAAGSPFVLDDVFSALRTVLDNRAKRASALGNLGAAVTAQPRTQYTSITHAVATPAPPAQCTILKSDYVRNIMRAGFDRTCFDKHGSASAKKRKRDVDASLRPIHRRRDDAMIAEGLVARVVSMAMVAQVVMTVTVLVL
ncbi:hypothetical protein DYB28_000151 [Aphanomyces astaci]|uniref:Uncharacterized protein n=1 Tax=Aphanomyces astaci TaxID=112090 RepID=A0A9X8E416_APHAT|nr:hypothetical protein DYB28_000151 [Aphanomyces astaci]